MGEEIILYRRELNELRTHIEFCELENLFGVYALLFTVLFMQRFCSCFCTNSGFCFLVSDTVTIKESSSYFKFCSLFYKITIKEYDGLLSFIISCLFH